MICVFCIDWCIRLSLSLLLNVSIRLCWWMLAQLHVGILSSVAIGFFLGLLLSNSQSLHVHVSLPPCSLLYLHLWLRLPILSLHVFYLSVWLFTYSWFTLSLWLLNFPGWAHARTPSSGSEHVAPRPASRSEWAERQGQAVEGACVPYIMCLSPRDFVRALLCRLGCVSGAGGAQSPLYCYHVCLTVPSPSLLTRTSACESTLAWIQEHH